MNEGLAEERWVSGKDEASLVADLHAYAARLRDNPYDIHCRLRVGAIQLRLERWDEAMVHYESVLRTYLSRGRVLSAITLCERLLERRPNDFRLKTILSGLIARAPRSAALIDRPVQPVEPIDDAFIVTAITGSHVEEITARRL